MMDLAIDFWIFADITQEDMHLRVLATKFPHHYIYI